MIIGIDIGGTKTLVAKFSPEGQLLQELRFPTNPDYERFISDLSLHAKELEIADAAVACVAVPGLLNREDGILLALGNLPWTNQPIREDIQNALNVKKVIIENDSKLAGYAEAKCVLDTYRRVYYLTVSTGNGGTLVVDGQLVQEIIDGEVGKVPFPRDGKLVHWEDFASGRAFVERYGKQAKDTVDPVIWQEFSQDLGLGLSMICSLYQVEAIIFGGGLGQYLERFKQYLKPYVDDYLHATIRRPKELLTAHYKDESVIYGCYEYGKDQG